MLIFPAIDLINGECVRLTQGDYNKKQIYSQRPLDIAKNFREAGALYLHIVDLDGAKSGHPVHHTLARQIVNDTGLSIQIGGGIRTFEDACTLLDSGIDRIILGTSAVTNPSLIKALLEQYGADRMIVSIDAKDENVLVEGWLKGSNKTLFEFIDELIKTGVKTIIFTDVKRDGMLGGPNLDAIARVIETGLNVIVAGGVSCLEDLHNLKRIGAYGAIIGKALYEGKIELVQAIKSVQNNTLSKRIIACMDIKDGRVVKGTHFKELKDAGDPVELAKLYSDLGADELVFLDITATVERRKTLCTLVKQIAKAINIPFTVGGGIGDVSDIKNLLDSGADKISIGSAAVRNPELISQAARAFGSQCVVISVDAKQSQSSWTIYIDGGRTDTGIDVATFVRDMQSLGAGELLVNSLDRDGTRTGYDLALLSKVRRLTHLPVIASSGAGKENDFLLAFQNAHVDAVLAAGVFHSGEIRIPDLKQYLHSNGIMVRI